MLHSDDISSTLLVEDTTRQAEDAQNGSNLFVMKRFNISLWPQAAISTATSMYDTLASKPLLTTNGQKSGCITVHSTAVQNNYLNVVCDYIPGPNLMEHLQSCADGTEKSPAWLIRTRDPATANPIPSIVALTKSWTDRIANIAEQLHYHDICHGNIVLSNMFLPCKPPTDPSEYCPVSPDQIILGMPCPAPHVIRQWLGRPPGTAIPPEFHQAVQASCAGDLQPIPPNAKKAPAEIKLSKTSDIWQVGAVIVDIILAVVAATRLDVKGGALWRPSVLLSVPLVDKIARLERATRGHAAAERFLSAVKDLLKDDPGLRPSLWGGVCRAVVKADWNAIFECLIVSEAIKGRTLFQESESVVPEPLSYSSHSAAVSKSAIYEDEFTDNSREPSLQNARSRPKTSQGESWQMKAQEQFEALEALNRDLQLRPRTSVGASQIRSRSGRAWVAAEASNSNTEPEDELETLLEPSKSLTIEVEGSETRRGITRARKDHSVQRGMSAAAAARRGESRPSLAGNYDLRVLSKAQRMKVLAESAAERERREQEYELEKAQKKEQERGEAEMADYIHKNHLEKMKAIKSTRRGALAEAKRAALAQHPFQADEVQIFVKGGPPVHLQPKVEEPLPTASSVINRSETTLKQRVVEPINNSSDLSPVRVNHNPQSVTDASNIKARVQAMYETYAPSRLGTVAVLLANHKGQEEDLMQKLVKKYGPEPASQSKAFQWVDNSAGFNNKSIQQSESQVLSTSYVASHDTSKIAAGKPLSRRTTPNIATPNANSSTPGANSKKTNVSLNGNTRKQVATPVPKSEAPSSARGDEGLREAVDYSIVALQSKLKKILSDASPLLPSQTEALMKRFVRRSVLDRADAEINVNFSKELKDAFIASGSNENRMLHSYERALPLCFQLMALEAAVNTSFVLTATR